MYAVRKSVIKGVDLSIADSFRCSDDEMLTLYQEGDTFAQEYILNKYKNLINSILPSYYVNGAEKDDLFQEGMIALHKAAINYRQYFNCSFKTYATVCVRRKIITLIRYYNAMKNCPLSNYVSIEDLEICDSKLEKTQSNKNIEVIDPETAYISKEARERILDIMNNEFSDFEKKVFMLYFYNGIGYKGMAKMFNKDTKSIDNAIQRIKGKIRFSWDKMM